MQLQSILFGNFTPPVDSIVGTRQHRMMWYGGAKPVPYAEPVKRKYASATRDKVFACLQKNPGATVTQLAMKTDIKKTGVRNQLYKMKELGVVRIERCYKRNDKGGAKEETWWVV